MTSFRLIRSTTMRVPRPHADFPAIDEMKCLWNISFDGAIRALALDCPCLVDAFCRRGGFNQESGEDWK